VTTDGDNGRSVGVHGTSRTNPAAAVLVIDSVWTWNSPGNWESKTEAEQIATDIRSAINAGTFRQTGGRAPSPPAQTVSAVVTLDQFAESYLTAVKGTGKR
jgi:hypothetical protein